MNALKRTSAAEVFELSDDSGYKFQIRARKLYQRSTGMTTDTPPRDGSDAMPGWGAEMWISVNPDFRTADDAVRNLRLHLHHALRMLDNHFKDG